MASQWLATLTEESQYWRTMARDMLKHQEVWALKKGTFEEDPAAATRSPWHKIFVSRRDEVWLSLHMEAILKQCDRDDIRRHLEADGGGEMHMFLAHGKSKWLVYWGGMRCVFAQAMSEAVPISH